MNVKHCMWTEDEAGPWPSECDNLFEFNNSGPTENGFTFCPYCGKELEIVRWSSEPEGEME